MLKNVVGLFGTCGDSRWRDDVQLILEQQLVDYFNPVVADWNDAAMKNEAEHAASDRVIMLVITGETTGIASMAESGWLASQAILRGQNLILVIKDMETELVPELRINKTRNLIRKHIAALPNNAPVTIFDDIVEAAYHAVKLIKDLK